MITINQSPKEFSLNENPIIFKMTSNNQFSPVGVKADHTIEFTSTPSDGDTFTLVLGDGVTLPFTFKTTPNETGLQLKTGGFMSLFISDLELSIRSNYTLTSRFTISSYYESVTQKGFIFLVALSEGASDNLTLLSPPSSMSLLTVTTGVTAVERLGFGLTLLIRKRIKGATDWTTIERFSKPYLGASTIDLSDVLDNELWRNKLPNISAAHSIATNAVCEYTVEYGETWGLPKSIQRLRKTNTLYFTDGGMSRKDHFQEDFYNRFASSGVGFVTWINHEVDIYEGEEHFLTYLRRNAVAEEISLNWEATDNSGGKTSGSSIIGNVTAYDIATMKISVSQLGLDSSNLRSFQVWIEETDTPDTDASSRITFRFQPHKAIDQTCLLYKNGLGFFDTFNLRGNKTAVGSSSAEKSTRASEAFIDELDHFEFTEARSGKTGYVVNTGHLSKSEMSRTMDLFLSEVVFLVEDGELVPVEVVGPSDLELFRSQGSRINNIDITVNFISDFRYGAIKA